MMRDLKIIMIFYCEIKKNISYIKLEIILVGYMIIFIYLFLIILKKLNKNIKLFSIFV
jgi:hypothetical protein